MKKLPYNKTLIISSIMIMLLSSCKKDFSANNYVAYFGGEVTNSTNPYILFCKNNEVIDTIPIKKDNTFFIKFDSLTPGLYSFKNDIVLDPFIGSGTTAIAALKDERRFVGYDIVEEYVNLSNKRLGKHLDQHKLSFEISIKR